MNSKEWRLSLDSDEVVSRETADEIIADLEAAEKERDDWKRNYEEECKTSSRLSIELMKSDDAFARNYERAEAAESVLASCELELDLVVAALKNEIVSHEELSPLNPFLCTYHNDRANILRAVIASPLREFAQRVKTVLQDGIDFWDDEDGDGLREWRDKARALLQAMGGGK